MANITKITAKDPNKPKTSGEPKDSSKDSPKDSPEKVTKKLKTVDKKSEKEAKKAEKMAQKAEKKSGKKPFILFRPFCALGRYFRDSWREIRQVRWPSRKSTWKMLLAVLVYTAFFMVLIVLLDALFTFLFNLIIA